MQNKAGQQQSGPWPQAPSPRGFDWQASAVSDSRAVRELVRPHEWGHAMFAACVAGLMQIQEDPRGTVDALARRDRRPDQT